MPTKKLLLNLISATAILTSVTGVTHVYAKEKQNEQQVELSQKKSDYASISHWNLEDDKLHLFFTGTTPISNEYSSTYYLETEKGIFTLQSKLKKQGHQIVTTLKDNQGNILYTNETKLWKDRNFDIAIPTYLLTHAFKSGVQIKICDKNKSNEIVVSTANTVPTYAVAGLGGLVLVGGGSLLLKKRRVQP